MIAWLSELSLADAERVGEKIASLAELHALLPAHGACVPPGFAITTEGFRRFLSENRLDDLVRGALAGLSPDDMAGIERAGRLLRQCLAAAPLPTVLVEAVAWAYDRLSDGAEGGADVAVRSSVAGGRDRTPAGLHESWLGVQGTAGVLDAVRRVMASLYTDRSVAWLVERRLDPSSVAMAVCVQRMVRADLAAAGEVSTFDVQTGFRDLVVVTSSWGLGEAVAEGLVVPDEFSVFKTTLREGHRPLLRRLPGQKEVKVVYDVGGSRGTRVVPVPPAERGRLSLGDDDVLELARLAMLVEEHRAARHQQAGPFRIAWARDGRDGRYAILQVRPVRLPQPRLPVVELHRLTGRGRHVVRGRAIGERIAVGTARRVARQEDLTAFRDGEILVAARTEPSWEPALRRAAAVVCERGGRSSHAAIVSREVGIPAIVGAEAALAQIRDGQVYTVCCAEGETGAVYAGEVEFAVQRADLSNLPRPRTRVEVNVSSPAEAFRLAALPCDGVGLARIEHIVASTIGVHPQALVEWQHLRDPAVRAEIDRRTPEWRDKAEFFVETLATGIGTIAAAFWPREVLVRFSDFKSNEYACLVGGALYEPREDNPAIGFRGASRYHDARYRDAFALECLAIRRVREDMGLGNVRVMVPFVRTVEEGRQVLQEMARSGLRRGHEGLQVYAMVEVPSNVVLIESFARVFDGFSIGSNDLAQLMLGVDRGSEALAALFDERDPAMTWAIRRAIVGARSRGRPIGLCGTAAGDHPGFARFLVEAGIDAVSFEPDALLAGVARLAQAEEDLVRAGIAPPQSPQGRMRLEAKLQSDHSEAQETSTLTLSMESASSVTVAEPSQS